MVEDEIRSQQPTQPATAKSCIGAAWQDIKSSDGWFSKSLLLGLISCVPIFGWFANGYCMSWGSAAAKSDTSPMSKITFTGRYFKLGFYYFVISLVCGLASSLVTGVLGLIVFVGSILAFLVSLYITMIEEVMVVRSGLSDSLNAAFNISKIVKAANNNFSSLFFAAVMPTLVVTVVLLAMYTLVFAINTAVSYQAIIDFYNNFYDVLDSSSSTSSVWGGTVSSVNTDGLQVASDTLESLKLLLTIYLPALIISYVLTWIMVEFSLLLTVRSVGYWVSRNESTWAQELSASGRNSGV